MSKRSIKILPATLIVIVFLLSIFFHYFTFSGGLHRVYTVLTANDAGIVAQKAIAGSDVSMCENIKLSLWGSIVGLGPDEQTLKDSCFHAYAVAKNDPLQCSKMGTRSASYCYEVLAPAVKDHSLCTLIKYDPVGAGLCMAHFVTLENNPMLCAGLADTKAVDTCYQFSKKQH